MTTLNVTTLDSKQLNQAIEQLNDMDTQTVIDIYNSYADENSYERVYDNDETTLNEVFDSPYDAIKQTNNFLYKDHENYFTFNGYGHAISFDYRLCDNSPIDIEDLAQWIVDNELFDDFDIEVTTIEDMFASIEDNITDASLLLYKLIDYLGNNILKTSEYAIEDVMNEISDYDYNQLNDVITHLGINYE